MTLAVTEGGEVGGWELSITIELPIFRFPRTLGPGSLESQGRGKPIELGVIPDMTLKRAKRNLLNG